MLWSNYGCYNKKDQVRKWNIDHIKSIAAFAKEGITDLKIINALSNLRPLDSVENSLKGQREQTELFYAV